DAAGTADVMSFALAHGRVSVLLAHSTAYGMRFHFQRITPTPFDAALSTAGNGSKHGAWWIGDYQGLAAGTGRIHPFWNDTRSGRLDIVTTAIPATGAR